MSGKLVPWDATITVEDFSADGEISFLISMPECNASAGHFEFDYTIDMRGRQQTARRRVAWRLDDSKPEQFEYDTEVDVSGGELVEVEVVASGTSAQCLIEEQQS
ncbi:hypothetical protein [Mesorhizobium sp.]|uniref:hypothetical protein n=1 Tax=Mesorhizobium sp. TaxID=1871066 RepID=UPI000FE4CD46|nr:hypothetical protein [Mesorhizobium sp.]RWE86935.1 MAG: hypothetical protein EOS49_11770 [Mesorhizobium sp.]